MILSDFKKNADVMLSQLEAFFERHLVETGLTEDSCQLVGFRTAVGRVRHLVNGTTNDDMKPCGRKLVGLIGYNQGAIFDMAIFAIRARDDQFENNMHLDVAEELGSKLGIADVRARFDEDDAVGAPIIKCYVVPADLKELDISEWTDDQLEQQIRLLKADVDELELLHDAASDIQET